MLLSSMTGEVEVEEVVELEQVVEVEVVELELVMLTLEELVEEVQCQDKTVEPQEEVLEVEVEVMATLSLAVVAEEE